MAEVTYYFDGYDAGSNQWADPGNLVDGDIGTYATEISDGQIIVVNTNTCPGSDLGTITMVHMRVYNYGDGDDRYDPTPIFDGARGDEHQFTGRPTPGWGTVIRIDGDTNAPSPFTWADVQKVDVELEFDKVGKGNTMYAAKVEIRVTYTESGGAQWKQLQYTSEPPTPNAWNQLKHTSAGGWNQIKFEGE